MPAGFFLKLQDTRQDKSWGQVRVFCNVWVSTTSFFSKVHVFHVCFLSLSDTLLDVHGNLEGESVVGAFPAEFD